MRKTIGLILALLMLVSVMAIGAMAANDICEHINVVTVEVIPSTCLEQGLTEGVYCNDCGEWLVVQEEMAALGHLWGNYEYNNDATCDRNGTEIATCKRCDVTDIREVNNSRIEHEYEVVVTVANCKEEGLITYTCDCGDQYTEITPKTDHADYNDDALCDVCGINIFSGKCGDNAYWSFNKETGTLTISGTCKIDDVVFYDEETGEMLIDENTGETVWNMPWYHLKNQINTLIIEEGITEIGAFAFYSFYYLTSVELPSTLEVVGCGAFCDCIRLEELDFPDSVKTLYNGNYNEIAIKKIVLPESLEATPTVPGIDEVFDFNMCAYLESITVPEEIGAIEAVIDISNPSIRNIYNYSTEALIKFDALNELWYGDEATAEYMTAVVGAYLELIGCEVEMTEEEQQAFILERIVQHYGEDYAEEIPEPVYSETVPDYIKIYCYENSAQHNYCVENNIDCVLIDENTHLDPLNNDGVCDVCGLNNMCGEKVYYEFDEATETLTLKGEGPTYDYKRYKNPFAHNDSIKNVIIEERITYLGEYIFADSRFEDVSISDSLNVIGYDAFVDCQLISINIGSGLEVIESPMFSYCLKLTNINVDDHNATFFSEDGVLFNKDKTLLIQYPAGKSDTSYTIADSVTTIGKNAFYSCQLEYLYIPNSVTKIAKDAFTYSDLIAFNVDADNAAYSNDSCGALFNKEKTVLIKYPTKNDRKEYTVPDTVISIGDYCFMHNIALVTVDLPDSLIRIGEYCFYGTTNITDIDIPESVIQIGNNAFQQTQGLTYIILPNKLSKISSSMFWCAPQLRTMVIPESITSIEFEAFGDCWKLTDVFFTGTKEQWNEIEIDETNNQVLENVTIHCNYDGISPIIVKSGPCGENVTYEFYSDGTLIISGTGAMADNFFEFSKLDIKNVIIKSGVTTIAGWAFSRSGMLTGVTISDSVTSIGDSAFSSCDSLASIVIPGSVTSIGKAAFFSCDNLTSITIPDSVTSIGDVSFCGCKGLTNITLEKSVKSVGKDAFDDCTNLTDVYFNGTRSEWNSIIIHSGNDSLLDATIHFNDCRHTEDGYATITKDENINEPTYTKDGSYDEVTICENCGAELSREIKVIPYLSLLETVVENIEDTIKGFYDALARVITKLFTYIKKIMG